MSLFNLIKNNVNKISNYEKLMVLVFFIIMIVSPVTGIAKAIVFSIGLYLGLIILSILGFSTEKKLIFLLAFTLPFRVILYNEEPKEMINLAGAKNFFVFNFYDLLIIFTAIYYLIKDTKLSTIKRNKRFLILPLLYLGIHMVTYFVAINKFTTFYEILRLIKNLLLFCVVAFYFTKKSYIVFIKGLGYSVIVQLFLGIIQIIIGKPIGLYSLGESYTVFRESVEGLEKGMSGTMAHPGTLGLYGVFCLSLFIFINKESIREKYIFVISSIILISLTFARTSMLLMLLVLTLFLLIYVIEKGTITKLKMFKFKSKVNRVKFYKLNTAIIIGILIITLGCGLIFKKEIKSVVNRFTSSDIEFQVNNRLRHVKLGLEIYKYRDHFAAGANNYTYVVKQKYADPYNKGVFFYVQPLHNLYLLYLIEIGFVGMALYIILYGKVALSVFKYRKINDKLLRRILLSTAIWAIAIMIYNLTGWSGAKDYFVQIMWIVIGLNVFVIAQEKGRLKKIEGSKEEF